MTRPPRKADAVIVLAEAAGWRALAERIDARTWPAPAGGRTGLCWALEEQLADATLQESARVEMRLALFCPDQMDEDPYWWTRDAAGDQQRVLACLLLAAMAEDEGR